MNKHSICTTEINLNVLTSGTDSKPYRKGCCFHLSVPNQFIFNPLVVEFFIVMASSSDVRWFLWDLHFFSTAEVHFSAVKAVYVFSEQFYLSFTYFLDSV